MVTVSPQKELVILCDEHLPKDVRLNIPQRSVLGTVVLPD